jgi:hypothetical protein
MSYFNDPWILTFQLASMEGVGHLGMTMPLSIVDVSYSIVQQASTNPNLAPPQELDPILEYVWAQDSLTTYYPMELLFPYDEAILESMTRLDRHWDDLHHRSYFLPELKRIEA